MIKQGKKVLMGAGVLAALVFGGSALSAAGAAQPAKAPAVEQTSGVDGDQVQSGDQTTPDTAAAADGEQNAAAEASSGESGSESSSEVPNNDGPGGHADEPANANADYQFNGQQ